MKQLITMLLPSLGLLLLLSVAIWTRALLKKRGRKEQLFLYEKAPSILSPAERSFSGVLEDAVGDQYRIFPKVRLADILRIREGMDRSAWQQAFNSIQSKHVDFLACDPKDLSIRFVVELDDKSHQKQDRRKRDEFLDRILAETGIPVFRFTAKSSYAVQEIRKRIASRVSKGNADSIEQHKASSFPSDIRNIRVS